MGIVHSYIRELTWSFDVSIVLKQFPVVLSGPSCWVISHLLCALLLWYLHTIDTNFLSDFLSTHYGFSFRPCVLDWGVDLVFIQEFRRFFDGFKVLLDKFSVRVHYWFWWTFLYVLIVLIWHGLIYVLLVTYPTWRLVTFTQIYINGLSLWEFRWLLINWNDVWRTWVIRLWTIFTLNLW